MAHLVAQFCKNALETRQYDEDELNDVARDALELAVDDEHLERTLRKHSWNVVTLAFNLEPNFEELLRDLEKRGRAKFVGIRFCERCNNMLFAKENKAEMRLYFVCKQQTCDYQEEATDNCVSIERMTQDSETLQYVTSEVAQDPTLPHTKGNYDDISCPVCSFDDAVFFQAQVNREKSKMMRFYVCCNAECGHKWTEDKKRDDALQADLF